MICHQKAGEIKSSILIPLTDFVTLRGDLTPRNRAEKPGLYTIKTR